MHRRRGIPIIAALLSSAAVISCNDNTQTTHVADAAEVTPHDVVGRWVLDPDSYENAAFNAILIHSRREGLAVSDHDIERASSAVLQSIHASPPEYVLNINGTFHASGHERRVTGDWSLDGGTVTLTSPTIENARRFNAQPEVLTSIPNDDRGRTIRLVRR